MKKKSPLIYRIWEFIWEKNNTVISKKKIHRIKLGKREKKSFQCISQTFFNLLINPLKGYLLLLMKKKRRDKKVQFFLIQY